MSSWGTTEVGSCSLVDVFGGIGGVSGLDSVMVSWRRHLHLQRQVDDYTLVKRPTPRVRPANCCMRSGWGPRECQCMHQCHKLCPGLEFDEGKNRHMALADSPMVFLVCVRLHLPNQLGQSVSMPVHHAAWSDHLYRCFRNYSTLIPKGQLLPRI